jgi:hypothetical protein
LRIPPAASSGLSSWSTGLAVAAGPPPPRGTLLGSEDYTFAANERKRVVLSLSPTGVQMLRRHGMLRVLVRVIEGGAEPSAGYLTVLGTP